MELKQTFTGPAHQKQQADCFGQQRIQAFTAVGNSAH